MMLFHSSLTQGPYLGQLQIVPLQNQLEFHIHMVCPAWGIVIFPMQEGCYVVVVISCIHMSVI